MSGNSGPEYTLVLVFGREPDWLGALNDCDTKVWHAGGHSRMYGVEVRDNLLYFSGGTCSVCCATSNCGATLLRCGGCKIVRYCSKEHQRQGWPAHKTFCKWMAVFDRLLSSNRGKTEYHSVWVQQQKELFQMFASTHATGVSSKYSMMFMQCPVCAVCHSNEVNMECPECCSTFYCCQEHSDRDAERHKRTCEHLKLMLLCEQHHFKYGGVVLPPILSKPLVEYQPLTGDIDSFVEEHLNAAGFLLRADSCQAVPIATLKDLLSEPLTVLYSLQEAMQLPRVEDRGTLTIHYVHRNMDVYFEPLVMWEYLLHRLPRLQELTLVYLIAEEPGQPLPVIVPSRKHVPCEDCRLRKRRVSRHHGYAFEANNFKKPDIVLWFSIDNTEPHPFKSLRLPSGGAPLLMTYRTPVTAGRVILDRDEKFHFAPTTFPLLSLRENPFRGGMPYLVASRETLHEDTAFPREVLEVVHCRNV